MSNVIDFNSRKNKKKGADVGTPPPGYQEMMNATQLLFRDLPQHDMTLDAADAVKRRVTRLLCFTELVSRANEAIQMAGLDPAGFLVNEESLDLFIARDIPQVTPGDRDGIEYFNGPFFEDDSDDKWLYRAATTIFLEGELTGMALAVMRLDGDAENWEMWYDGQWHKDGPPRMIFEAIAMEAIRGIIEAVSGEDISDIFDDDDDDDDWENSIESMLLMPGTIAALARAGIDTIDQLAAMTEKEVLAIKGIGKKTLEEIKNALDLEDLKLKE